MPPTAPPRTSQVLSSVATILWPLFLATTVLVAIVWVSGFGPGTATDPDFVRKVPNGDLRAALVLISRALDPLWVTLGAINSYLALVRAEGLAVARRWSGTLLLVSFGIAAISATAGFPLGPVYFPTNLGWKLGPVPFAWPFLWMLIVPGARECVLRALPKASHRIVSLLTGSACLFSDLLLEPIAWKYRAWWLWYPAQLTAPNTAPWCAYATWFLAGTVVAFLMRSPHVAPRLAIRPVAPALAYGLFNAVLLLTLVLR